MIAVLSTLAIRLALCGLVTYVAFRFGGLTTAVPTVVLYAIALPKPLLDLASELRHGVRRAHWRDREGRHYVYHGMPLTVHEDVDHRRWVGLVGVRAIVGFTASDATLRVAYPDAWQMLGRPAAACLRDDALIAHLKTERAPAALKFRHWVEREIAFPARRQRDLLGIRTEALVAASKAGEAPLNDTAPKADGAPAALNPVRDRGSDAPAPSSNSRR
ncbi:MAG: hypothetical protein ABIS28_04000 [Caldimonas sp.]